MPERKPAPNGTLDPRLVRDSEHMHAVDRQDSLKMSWHATAICRC